MSRNFGTMSLFPHPPLPMFCKMKSFCVRCFSLLIVSWDACSSRRAFRRSLSVVAVRMASCILFSRALCRAIWWGRGRPLPSVAASCITLVTSVMVSCNVHRPMAVASMRRKLSVWLSGSPSGVGWVVLVFGARWRSNSRVSVPLACGRSCGLATPRCDRRGVGPCCICRRP